ncbi:MAG: hypothetical protein ACKVPX_00815 [Myxococcaceae bacterium]
MSTYFAEGLPYMLVRILSSVYFTDLGVRERYLGYLNFLGLPWNAKFLWAPFVDRLGTKRAWMVGLQLGLGVLTAAVALLAFLGQGAANVSPYLTVTSGLFVAMAFVSATNDVAVDGHYLEALSNPRDQAAFSGYRVLAYRISMVFARSGLVALAAWVSAGAIGARTSTGWSVAFSAGAATLVALATFHAFGLPRVEPRAEATTPPSYVRAFLSYLDQERVGVVLAFVALYKLGDEILFSMATPFLMRELGVSKEQFAWVGGLVGALATVLGAMWGGRWISKVGLAKAIWPMTLFMNVNIWAYVWLAWAKPQASTSYGIFSIALIHGYEQFAAGLGSAVLLVFLLGTCKPDFKAAHYAIGSALMSLGASLIGGFGGRIVESVGYLNLFILAFVASLPSMLLLPWLPLKAEPVSAASAG